jgi:hypothetical protein
MNRLVHGAMLRIMEHHAYRTLGQRFWRRAWLISWYFETGRSTPVFLEGGFRSALLLPHAPSPDPTGLAG